MSRETIVALSTPPGRGGIAIVRASGDDAAAIAEQLSGRVPVPRFAQFTALKSSAGELLDEGVMVYYESPHSYTGDDLVEFQIHGNPFIVEQLIAAITEHGARIARPGEFTERAFLAGKLDLNQAEAVADLIAGQSQRAVRSAQRTLKGEFGHAVAAMIDAIHEARAALEAQIDFADDVVAGDFAATEREARARLTAALNTLLQRASSGASLAEGANIAIVGAPNVGKSSLLNRFAASDRAIVAATPGTTRDLIDCDVLINDIPVRVVDTAGLRQSPDEIEVEGMRRARGAADVADLTLLVTENQSPEPRSSYIHELRAMTSFEDYDAAAELLVIHNKIDQCDEAARSETWDGVRHVWVSALTGAGIAELGNVISISLGIEPTGENEIMAHGRHLHALRKTLDTLERIGQSAAHGQLDLVAEHYRHASRHLEAISGRYATEDMLGDIFSRFCIGK
ncbi:MAG: tRNA uridine-5-carboxymethylaminomethyl(34) synthesis GTPase MnmE [Gammaproteobacteria bacterium]